MTITKTLLWALVLPAVSLWLLGCYALGTFAGYDEQIIPREPALAVRAPAPQPPAVEPAAPSSKAILPPPEIPVTAPKAPAGEAAVATASAALPDPLATLDPAAVIAQTPEAIVSQSEKALTTPVVAPVPAETAPPAPAAPAPAEKTPPAPETPVVTAEKMIEDAAKLDSNSTRRSVYVAVAKRFDLGPNAQIRLVNDAYDNLVSETAIEEVFITLIQNPNFAPAAQHAILKRADDFLSEPAKQRIMAALTSRP